MFTALPVKLTVELADCSRLEIAVFLVVLVLGTD